MHKQYSFREDVLLPLTLCAGIGMVLCSAYTPPVRAPVEPQKERNQNVALAVREEELLSEPVYRTPFPPAREHSREKSYSPQFRSYVQRRGRQRGRTRS